MGGSSDKGCNQGGVKDDMMGNEGMKMVLCLI